MGTVWTSDQKKVISFRDKSILVSAAAGSGKTAVLVERILSKLKDPVHPVSIDRMLIMTFTRAAAGEMKERIQKAVEEALLSDPDNAHLQKQLTLIHMAQINTIDGFCAWILRNYFHLIHLDPGYRVGDDGELKLIQQDTVRSVLDEFHEEGNQDFFAMLDAFCPGKSDDNLRETILGIYSKAMSHPDPLSWLDDCLAGFDAESEEEAIHLPWMKDLWKIVLSEVTGAEEMLLRAKAICRDTGGPYHFEDGVDDCLCFIGELKRLAEAESFDGFCRFLMDNKMPDLSRKRPKDVDEGKKADVSELRKEARAMIENVRKNYFQQEMADVLKILKICRPHVEMLVSVVRRFMERYQENKGDKNILDFTDMEHLTLQILAPGDGEEGGSAAARELSERFDEVMIDEYQDSNLIQEMIAGYVSGWVNHRKNLFMVGDVKQSIYRFRLARPEIFMEKYHRFSKEDGPEVRIDLHKNFRSRPEVLSSVNYIFRQIMGSDLGGIDYGDDEALYPGAGFPEGQDPAFCRTELLLVRKDDPLLEDEESLKNARELEARMIAGKIEEMVGKSVVYDRAEGGYRPLRYGDIAILLRSFAGWSEPFMEVLTSRGIPAYAASRSGYFSAAEVITMLNYLRILDNPRQDIYLAGVLRSPIGGCSDEELALLRAAYKKGRLIDSVQAFLEELPSAASGGEAELPAAASGREAGQPSAVCGGEELTSAVSGRKMELLYEKLSRFMAEYERFRDKAVYTPVHDLIREILKDTGYGLVVKAMPDGARRSANLFMLAEKAMEYEKTSYHGLFHFIRYMENLHKYEVDYGEANLSDAGTGAVQLMTIHKSKGLEFPVVFVSGLGKKFNFMDANEAILVDSDLGIAPDAVLPDQGMKISSLKRKLTREHIVSENLGEELRVLYVALTRAKEKLIMTGTVADFPKVLSGLSDAAARTRELLPLRQRMKAKTYLDYLLPALAGHRCMTSVFQENGLLFGKNPLLHDDPSDFLVRVVEVSELVDAEVVSQGKSLKVLHSILEEDPEETADSGIRERLEERFSYSYPYQSLAEIPEKMTVSELKKRHYHEEDDQLTYDEKEEPVIPLFPKFLMEDKEEALLGSARGTAYHRVMECLDYSSAATEEEVREQISALVDSKKLGKHEAECVRTEDVQAFLRSPLGGRMKDAALSGKLFREQPFMIQKRASDLDGAWDPDTNVLVQGIIDAWFFEGDEIVLVDYKTDRVFGAAGKEKLLTLYQTQLVSYAEALRMLTGKRVKEIYIWSFAMGEMIRL